MTLRTQTMIHGSVREKKSQVPSWKFVTIFFLNYLDEIKEVLVVLFEMQV